MILRSGMAPGRKSGDDVDTEKKIIIKQRSGNFKYINVVQASGVRDVEGCSLAILVISNKNVRYCISFYGADPVNEGYL